MANFCLSGSLQSSRPGQLTCIMVLYSTESQFRGGGGEEREHSLIFTIRFCTVSPRLWCRRLSLTKEFILRSPLILIPVWSHRNGNRLSVFRGAARADVVYLHVVHRTSFNGAGVELSARPQFTLARRRNRAISLGNCRLIGCVSFD